MSAFTAAPPQSRATHLPLLFYYLYILSSGRYTTTACILAAVLSECAVAGECAAEWVDCAGGILYSHVAAVGLLLQRGADVTVLTQ